MNFCEFFCFQVLQQIANANIRVYMNCKEKLSEMPLKRYVLAWYCSTINKVEISHDFLMFQKILISM